MIKTIHCDYCNRRIILDIDITDETKNQIIREFLEKLQKRKYCLCNTDYWINACKNGTLDEELEGDVLLVEDCVSDDIKDLDEDYPGNPDEADSENNYWLETGD